MKGVKYWTGNGIGKKGCRQVTQSLVSLSPACCSGKKKKLGMENGGAPAATDKVPWRRAQTTLFRMHAETFQVEGRKSDKWVGDGSDGRSSLQNHPRARQ